MPSLELGDRKIDPGTAADLDRLFAEKRILGVKIQYDRNRSLQATVTGDVAMLFSFDQKEAVAQRPQGRVNRDGA